MVSSKKRWLVGVLQVAAVISLGGCTVGNSPPTSGGNPVTIKGFMSATVTDVSDDGGSICARPDSGGDKVCGVAFQAVGAPRLIVGDHVAVAIEEVQVNSERSDEIYVVYSPPPP